MVTKILHFELKSYFLTLLVDSGRSASASLVSKNIHFFSHVFKKRLFSIFCISLWDLDKLLENNSKFTTFFHKKSEYFLKPDCFEICPPSSDSASLLAKILGLSTKELLQTPSELGDTVSQSRQRRTYSPPAVPVLLCKWGGGGTACQNHRFRTSYRRSTKSIREASHRSLGTYGGPEDAP